MQPYKYFSLHNSGLSRRFFAHMMNQNEGNKQDSSEVFSGNLRLGATMKKGVTMQNHTHTHTQTFMHNNMTF